MNQKRSIVLSYRRPIRLLVCFFCLAHAFRAGGAYECRQVLCKTRWAGAEVQHGPCATVPGTSAIEAPATSASGQTQRLPGFVTKCTQTAVRPLTFLGRLRTRERMDRSVSITLSGSTRSPGGPVFPLVVVAVDSVIRRSSLLIPLALCCLTSFRTAGLLPSPRPLRNPAVLRARELRSSSSSWRSFDAKRPRRLRLVRPRPASTRQLESQPPRLSAKIGYVFAGAS